MKMFAITTAAITILSAGAASAQDVPRYDDYLGWTNFLEVQASEDRCAPVNLAEETWSEEQYDVKDAEVVGETSGFYSSWAYVDPADGSCTAGMDITVSDGGYELVTTYAAGDTVTLEDGSTFESVNGGRAILVGRTGYTYYIESHFEDGGNLVGRYINTIPWVTCPSVALLADGEECSSGVDFAKNWVDETSTYEERQLLVIAKPKVVEVPAAMPGSDG